MRGKLPPVILSQLLILALSHLQSPLCPSVLLRKPPPSPRSLGCIHPLPGPTFPLPCPPDGRACPLPQHALLVSSPDVSLSQAFAVSLPCRESGAGCGQGRTLLCLLETGGFSHLPSSRSYTSKQETLTQPRFHFLSLRLLSSHHLAGSPPTCPFLSHIWPSQGPHLGQQA